MATCLINLVEEIGKRILNQFVDQFVTPFLEPNFNYWWCFDTNIQQLREEVEHLDQIIGARVFVLFQEKREEGGRILQDHNIPAWNIISRYSMGKRAKKTATEIAKLLNDGNFNTTTTIEFESRKSIENSIVDCLRDRETTVGMIVICGMGGVGKTEMAKRIRERVKEEDIFDDVVMVTVSQTINIQKIQSEIAEWLKLEFHVMHETTRAAELRKRLMDTKRKIIILDDAWDSFKSKHLEDLGIPIEYKMCKVLLTSRQADVCKEINNKNVFRLKILEENDAWRLFKDKAGNWIEGPNVSSDLKRVATEVAAECKGLPLALVTVGLALQNKTDIYTWNNALTQLREANPEDFSEVSSDVYNPLKLSYDYLDSDMVKDLFLLCCLFPEDFNISVEQLIWYSMGLELFPGVHSIEVARNRTHTLIGKLESRFLLIDAEEEGERELKVKMHDVIRDVAIYIGSIERRGFLKSLISRKNSSDENCNWMSHIDENCNWVSVDISNEQVDISNEQMGVHVLSQFQKLRLLMLSSSNEFYDISHMSFEGMEGLKVLSFESISIPPSLGSLKNLQTLRLFRCKIENISFIGKLTSLKILSCCECEKIMELPAAIGKLKGLRLLELNKCHELKRIPFGIISSLSRLEELKILGSFSEWKTEGEGRNASLTELNSLPNLTCLEIHISDCTLSALEISLKKLVRYRICINNRDYFGDRDYEKVMILYLERDGAVGDWIRRLARNAESLTLIGDGSDNINLAVMENLRYLSFTKCSRVKKLVDTARTRLLQLEVLQIDDCESMEQVFWNEARDNNRDGCIEFSKLEELRLKNLPNLTAFCQGLENLIIKFPNLIKLKIIDLPKLNGLFPLNSGTLENTLFCNPSNPKDVSFCNLKSMYISGCGNLRYLSSVWAARRCLLQLEDLRIHSCESMEEVFWNDDNINGCIEFPKLKEVSLYNLPNLTAFCQGFENFIIKFPNLTQMEIEGLPKLNSLFPPNSKEVSLGNLKKITIERCCNLRCLFSVSAAGRYLLQLEYLCIQFCESMEEVFWNDDNINGCIEFPKLEELSLVNLPNLTAFCQGFENFIIKFPNLTELSIGRLPKLNSHSPLNSETVVWHDHNTFFHFVCNPKVEMGLLNDLTLWALGDNIKNIWCHQIPNNFFNNLERLQIYLTNGIRSLMSTSIAKNLVNLKFLRIHQCEEMVEVIEIDDDNDKQEVEINRLFPNLRELYLNGLHKLIRFWQWNHALELPLLEEINISNCPAMETFTLGSINTPKIREISINDENIEDHKDLNDVIRHMWTKSQDTFESEEDWIEEDGDEDANKDEKSMTMIM